jgi:hypothetical protein
MQADDLTQPKERSDNHNACAQPRLKLPTPETIVETIADPRYSHSKDTLTPRVTPRDGFLDERDIVGILVPVSKRTWQTWKEREIVPFIRVGRRCLYHWPSVQQALLRKQRGGRLEVV